jgi:hypothetical protein
MRKGVLVDKSTDWNYTEGFEERKEEMEDWIIGW